jgi:hypothetical protein
LNVYKFSEARQNLAAVLDEAQRKGAVRIQRRDGSEFEIAPVHSKGSPLDVEGISLGVTANEIVSAIREVREREER